MVAMSIVWFTELTKSKAGDASCRRAKAKKEKGGASRRLFLFCDKPEAALRAASLNTRLPLFLRLAALVRSIRRQYRQELVPSIRPLRYLFLP